MMYHLGTPGAAGMGSYNEAAWRHVDIAYSSSLKGACLKVVMEMVAITRRDNESTSWDLLERKLGLDISFR